MNQNIFTIGLAGSSGSGKSSISKIIANRINTKSVTVLHEKGYYKNKNDEPVLEKKEHNFDHPSDFDNRLLISQLKQLEQYKTVREPYYSFQTHTQLSKQSQVKRPAKVIIIEGPLVLYDERLRKLLNLKVFVNASSDLRVIRRLKKDISRYHWPLNSSLDYYVSTIKPMYQQFIEPTKRYADIIIPESWKNNVAIDLIITKINSWLRSHKGKKV